MPVTLIQLGDVLTDAELAQLLQRPLSWPSKVRQRARRAGVEPDLPPSIFVGRWARHRYRKQDVLQWLAQQRQDADMRRRRRAS